MAKKITSTASRTTGTGRKSAASKGATKRAAAAKTVSGKSGATKYQVIAKTRDGVSILGPAVEPTHFTSDEIRKTIRDVLGKR